MIRKQIKAAASAAAFFGTQNVFLLFFGETGYWIHEENTLFGGGSFYFPQDGFFRRRKRFHYRKEKDLQNICRYDIIT